MAAILYLKKTSCPILMANKFSMNRCELRKNLSLAENFQYHLGYFRFDSEVSRKFKDEAAKKIQRGGSVAI